VEVGAPSRGERTSDSLDARSAVLAKRYSDLGADTLGGSPETAAKFLADEMRKWAEVVRFSGAKID